MKQLLHIYTEKWYAPIILSIILGLIGLLTLSFRNEIIYLLSLGIPFLSIIISIFLGLRRFAKKDYLNAVLQIFISGTIGLCCFIFVSFYLMFYPYDYFADSLEIPQNIKAYLPKDAEEVNGIRDSADFEIYSWGQPGIYKYDVWLSKVDSGIIYLKAYEITKNYPLSVDRLEYKSKMKVFNPIDTLTKFRLKKDFTIYEGDWGKPYATRFEVWYKSDKGDKEEKILQKNYIIEGWMR